MKWSWKKKWYLFSRSTECWSYIRKLLSIMKGSMTTGIRYKLALILGIWYSRTKWVHYGL